MGYPLRMLKYLKQDTTVKRKLTFLLPENYRENIDNLKGLRENVLTVFDLPCFANRINILTYKADNSDILEKIEELKNMPKFDVAIMNPPYDGELHVKILKTVITKAKTVVNISPNIFYNYRKNYNLLPNELYDYSYETSCSIFGGIQLQCPVAISVYNNTNIYADIQRYRPKLFNIFETKIKFKKSFKDVNNIDYDNTGIYVPLKLMTATWDKNKNIITDKLGILNNGYTVNNLYYKDVRQRNKDRPCGGIKFNTIREARNFYNSCNTTFFKAFVHIYHVASRYLLKDYPFMHSYQYPWTNKRFCEYFRITGFISDTEAVPSSEWEEILNTMKDFE